MRHLENREQCLQKPSAWVVAFALLGVVLLKVPLQSQPANVRIQPASRPVGAVTKPSVRAARPGRFSEERDIQLPDVVDDIVSVDGGRRLVLFFKKPQKLAIFDVREGKLTGDIPLASTRVLLAGAKTKIVVADLENKCFDRYDIDTLKKELSKPYLATWKPRQIAMGEESTGPLLVTGTSGKWAQEFALLDLDTLETLKREPRTPEERTSNFGESAFADYWASANGKVFSMQNPSGSHGYVISVEPSAVFEKPAAAGKYKAWLIPSPDGRFILGDGYFAATKDAARPDPAVLKTFAGEMLFPTHSNEYFVGFPQIPSIDGKGNGASFTWDNPASLYATEDQSMLLALPDMPEIEEIGKWIVNGIRFDKRFHAVPALNTIVTLDASNRQLVLRRMDFGLAVSKLSAPVDGGRPFSVRSQPPLIATRGALYEYQIELAGAGPAIEHVQYILTDGPEGMALSSSGKLRWEVPVNYRAKEYGVIITIQTIAASDVATSKPVAFPPLREMLHSFLIKIR